MFAIEIFAGSGRLTASIRAVGLQDSFGVDLKLPSTLRSPIIKYDLTQDDHLAIVISLIQSEFCCFVHFAPPCGTSSRARLIQRKGRWNPPIVRTDSHPDGLPNLQGTLADRVAAANKLYSITCDLIEICLQKNIYFAVENPGRSFMWLTKPFQKLIQKYPHLFEVFFHHCKYGSARRKLTKFLHNIPAFQSLESFCQNDHPHEPWGRLPNGQWTTAEETAYPWELCRAVAAKLLQQLQADGYHCAPPVFALQEATLQTMRATTEIQPRKGLQPMVSEFVAVHPHPANAPLPDNSRKISTPHRGYIASAGANPSEDNITIGVHRSPESFVNEAIKIGHPTRMHSFFPDEITKVVDLFLRNKQNVAMSRTEEIKRWIQMAQDLASQERELKEGMSERKRTVLKDKKLVLFRTLLMEAEHEDTDLVEQLTKGFDLTGMLPESKVFGRKVRPATMSCQELRRAADLGRAGILQSVKSSGDPELDELLYAATLKEVSKGFLEEDIKPDTLPEGSTLTRRFGVKQKSKVRPIDDYKASFVNASVSQTETASVHTVDHIASLICCVMRSANSSGQKIDLCAKTWDLSDAYKQVPLSDEAYSLDAYLAVFCPETNGPKVFQQKVLPFGSVASVTAFLRVAYAIWRLGTRLLGLMWTSYFDDFFSVEDQTLSKHTDLVISSLFNILGWKLSVEKLVDYYTTCKVLGVEFDLKMSGDGLSFVYNTDERIEELCNSLNAVIEAKTLRKSEGERLRGRLQFACGQLFGRAARNHIRVLSNHIKSSKNRLCDDTVEALCLIRNQIRLNIPRRLVGSLADHIHIYVDASFDEGKYSGIGGVVYCSSGQPVAFFSESMDHDFLSLVKAGCKENVIQELEMLALLTAVEMWGPVWNGHRVVAFTDSESVRGSFLKTWSGNEPCHKLLTRVFTLEESHLCPVWLERVPSQSNPSDPLSRSQVTSWENLERCRVDFKAIWCHAISGQG